MAKDDKSSLTYDGPPAPPIPRWQFRLLFLLVLVNLAISVQMAYAPGVTSAAQRWWTDWQATRKKQAVQRQAWTWTQPPRSVVWEEDPERAAPMIADREFRDILVPRSIKYGNAPHLRDWPRGAASPAPRFAYELQENFPIFDASPNIPQDDEDWALVMLHGRTSAAGRERLVYVVALGTVDFHSATPVPREAPDHGYTRHVNRKLRLIATACARVEGSQEPRPGRGDTMMLVIAPNGKPEWLQEWNWDPPSGNAPGKVGLQDGVQLRFYAAQMDPADPAHFTIDYDLNDRSGTIHGRLKDNGTVELKPEAGRVTGALWDPTAP